MSVTKNLIIQHKEILKVVDDISSRLITDELSKDATYIYGLLLELSDNLGAHLRQEDEALYPALFRHPDKHISKLAKIYIEEMGGIDKAFKHYLSGWPHAAVIQEKPEEFIAETRKIFSTLCERIKKENSILYPLLTNSS